MGKRGYCTAVPRWWRGGMSRAPFSAPPTCNQFLTLINISLRFRFQCRRARSQYPKDPQQGGLRGPGACSFWSAPSTPAPFCLSVCTSCPPLCPMPFDTLLFFSCPSTPTNTAFRVSWWIAFLLRCHQSTRAESVSFLLLSFSFSLFSLFSPPFFTPSVSYLAVCTHLQPCFCLF
jgi:hypothetical protein